MLERGRAAHRSHAGDMVDAGALMGDIGGCDFLYGLTNLGVLVLKQSGVDPYRQLQARAHQITGRGTGFCNGNSWIGWCRRA